MFVRRSPESRVRVEQRRLHDNRRGSSLDESMAWSTAIFRTQMKWKKNFSLFFVLKLYVSSLFLLCVAPRSKVLPKTCFFFLFQTHFFFRKEIYVVVIVRSPPWRLWPGAVPYPPSLSPNESSDQWCDSVSCALSFRVPPRYFITNTKCLLAI